MSTKAYDFHIMDKSKLPKFLDWAKDKIYYAMMKRFTEVPELLQIMKNPFDDKNYNKVMKKITEVMQSTTYTKEDEYDLTCGVTVFLWNKYAVVKVYGLHQFVRTKLPTYVSNFEYWNNTDKPDEVSGVEWRRRERFFDVTADKIQSMQYIPLEFLTNSRGQSLAKLYRYYEKYEKMTPLEKTIKDKMEKYKLGVWKK